MTYRPPYTPVTIGALAGRDSGAFLAPTRATPMQDWHEDNGAVFTPAGLWQRPHYYPRPGESAVDAVNREVLGVRQGVGIVDVSTLGRIDLHGGDVAEFLNRVYINGFKTLAIGMCRYGVMLRHDGRIFDDGTIARMGERHYVMTTTTANAGPVMAHLEYYSQVVWPELDLHLTSVTDQWAVAAVAGPQSRALLEKLGSDLTFANQAMPFMAWLAVISAACPRRYSASAFRANWPMKSPRPPTMATQCGRCCLRPARTLASCPMAPRR